jgi:hypothetical protein
VFYRSDDGKTKSLSQMWGAQPPAAVAALTACLRLARQAPVRQALRTAAWRPAHIVL